MKVKHTYEGASKYIKELTENLEPIGIKGKKAKKMYLDLQNTLNKYYEPEEKVVALLMSRDAEARVNELIPHAVAIADMVLEGSGITDKELGETLWNGVYHREMDAIAKKEGLRF